MHDELNKKRSTTKITAVSEHPVATLKQATHKRHNTGIKMDSVTRKNSKSRYHTRDTRGRAGRRDNSRITKSKSKQTRGRRSSCKTYKIMKIKANIGCQCSTYYIAKDKKNGTDNIVLPPGIVDKMAVDENSFRCYHLNQNLADVNRPRTYNDMSSKESKQNNPDTEGSVSTYNSYASLEHEPMIS
ncbi:unnamed protein product [Diatraea saccharalis]|uniref:Uncharacterized protein n=1 Tax=Diatraea saccharalis TaxID=40085 RepID=A0A9P0C7R9_9NEOP|nr:unnamed protein product [Diatraea saccharalis]